MNAYRPDFSKEGAIKVLFQLEQDEDGYPPVAVESVWARKTEDGFWEIDNIPFFVRGIAYRDVVDAELLTEETYNFRKIVRRSGHSTIRIIPLDSNCRDEILRELESYGCTWEGSHQQSLVALDVPPNTDIEMVLRFLMEKNESNVLDYEEAAIRDGF